MRMPTLAGRCALAASLALPTAAFAVQDCEINGQHVNPANGGTTEGKTGIMKCLDRDTGKLVREEEYRNGRSIGYRKFIDTSGDTIVSHYNERGNRDGELKRYDAAGTLLAHERYVNGSTAGPQTHFHKNSQVKRRSFDEQGRALASIEYNERGQLTELQCADKPLLEEDATAQRFWSVPKSFGMAARSARARCVTSGAATLACSRDSTKPAYSSTKRLTTTEC